MTPGDATMRAAAGYERGDNDVSALIDAADRETSGIVSGRLADCLLYTSDAADD